VSLFLVPATRENLEKSIELEVPSALVLSFVPPEVVAEIQARAGVEGIRCWAMTTAKRAEFNAMKPGDIVLLSEKDTRCFTHCAQVTFKLENKKLGDALWPVRGENPWELIYFLRDIRHINIPKSEFVTRFDYASNFAVAGTTRVTEDRLQFFESRFGALEDLFDVPATELLAHAYDDEAADYSATENTVISRRRRQHERFATEVKKNYGMACAMCGIAERDFLVAGHIVAWAEDAQNRLNPANGICLCVLHDRAFERGYLLLDDALHIRMNPRVDAGSQLAHQLRAVEGQRLRVPVKHPPAPEFLRRHRDRFLPRRTG